MDSQPILMMATVGMKCYVNGAGGVLYLSTGFSPL